LKPREVIKSVYENVTTALRALGDFRDGESVKELR
jgi:hypothetical protein